MIPIRSTCLLYLITLFTAACLYTPYALAQEAGKGLNFDELPPLPPAEEGDVVCRCITTFLLGKKEVYHLKIGKSYYVAPLTGEGMSQAIPVRGSRKLVLYKEQPAEGGGVTYVPAVEAPLGDSGKLYMVILTKKKDNKVTAKAHNLSSTEFPASRIYLFNESPATLGVQINTTQKVVKPYEFFSHSFGDSDRNTYTSAKIVMRYKGENKIMASKRLRLVPGRRIILTCFPSRTRLDLGSTGLRLLTYQDKP